MGKKGNSKIKFRQSASESLCLIRYLGLIIGDRVPAENQYWKLYLCLRKIGGVLTSPQLTKGRIKNVGMLIQKHNILHFKFFGKLKPKMHILGGVKSNLLDRQNALLLQKNVWCLVVRSCLGRHTKFQCDTGFSFVLTADCC